MLINQSVCKLYWSFCIFLPRCGYGWLYAKTFYRCKYLNLKTNNYENYMNIPFILNSGLEWWRYAIDHSVCKIKDDNYHLEVYSDASTTGWGISCRAQRASDLWSDDKRSNHINYLEIFAALWDQKYSLKICLTPRFSFASSIPPLPISYVSRMCVCVCIEFPHLTNITKQL